VRFWPDASMFTTTTFDYDTIKIRLRQQAYLTKGITITFLNEFEDTAYRFFFEGGIESYVQYLNRSIEPVTEEVFYVDKQIDHVQVEISLQYKKDDYNEKTISFVNNVITPEGGTHVVGFKMALTRTINKYAREQEILKEKDQNLANEDVVE
jgi:DNA gyrase subunit B